MKKEKCKAPGLEPVINHVQCGEEGETRQVKERGRKTPSVRDRRWRQSSCLEKQLKPVHPQ